MVGTGGLYGHRIQSFYSYYSASHSIVCCAYRLYLLRGFAFVSAFSAGHPRSLRWPTPSS